MLNAEMSLDEVVFLVDVDNTLLDNDRFIHDLGVRLEHSFGAAGRARYFAGFAEMRSQTGFVDYLGALQCFRAGLDDDPLLLQLGEFILDYPFAERLYPGALAVLARLATFGRTAVLSDGDVVLQPHKARRAGIWDAVDGRVMIYVHKEQVMDHVVRRHPASRYVVIDDKPNLLAAMKRVLGAKLSTVFVRQGQYALAPKAGETNPLPDRVVERISDLLALTPSDFEVAP